MSNQLNGVMKVLTIIATILMPLTVITGMWGMNVTLPNLQGGQAFQFWWVARSWSS
ncbi:MAG: CorA family divalent cation transporter [Acidobacteriota bacterium]|nr:CorA family divalent cation transporter [Acidobacteriota bacterium]